MKNVYPTASDRVLRVAAIERELAAARQLIDEVVAAFMARTISGPEYYKQLNEAKAPIPGLCEEYFNLTGKLI